MMQEEVKQNILSGRQWLRMLFMAGYILATWVLTLVLLVVIFIQTIIVLITGETNHNLRRFGIMCGVFMHQIIHFLVYGSDDKPFPFSDFPDIDHISATDDVASEDLHEYSYRPGTAAPAAAASAPVYEEIIPPAESIDADDDFPPATDTGSDPERLS